jgi:hypothetical protein
VTEIAAGEAVAVDVPAGARLRVTVSEGRQLADLAPAGFHQGLTRNVAGWRRHGRPSLALGLGEGDELVDGDARPLMRIVAGPGPGQVDVAYPGCWRELYDDRRPGCRDLIAEALGIPRAALGGVVSLFGAPPRLEDGALHGWEGVAARPGSELLLEAVVPCRVAVSACPDDGIPGVVPGSLRVDVAP